jgi:chaperone modulatory protein CbpM
MNETLLSISLEELCLVEGIKNELIFEIVEYEIVKPLDSSGEDQWLFDTSSIHWIKKALRLRQDLEIDWVAVAMLIDLMKQRDAFQKENELLRRQLSRFIKNEIVN